MLEDIAKIKYPSINYLAQLEPSPEISVLKDIIWQEKQDGSNIGCYLDRDGEIRFRSRNQEIAHPDFYNAMERTGKVKKIKQMLTDFRKAGNADIVFGELLLKGKSPTRVTTHPKDDFIIFDIWSQIRGAYLRNKEVYLLTSYYELDMVKTIAETWHTNLLSVYAMQNDLLFKCQSNGLEGVVAKFWIGGDMFVFKAKPAMPRLEKIPREISDKPELPHSEVWGAIDKVKLDIGLEDYKNIKIAMPKIAAYVKEECNKHNCRLPDKKLVSFYLVSITE